MPDRAARLFCLLLILIYAGSTADQPRILPNDAYIWQFVWTPALIRSVTDNADTVESWRVLADEIRADGSRHVATPDWAALSAANKPVTLVHRIDGRADTLDSMQVVQTQTIATTSARDAGVRVTGIEIDFDCATARLAEYAAFLQRLRAGLPGDIKFSITALPTWLASRDLTALLAVPDETVLQVHAVADPRHGLFDPAQAMGWIGAWAQRNPKLFRVALPSYLVRAAWAKSGQLVAVTAEAPQFTTGDTAAELIAEPAILTDFVRKLSRHPPVNLAGLVWFRLPSADDKRSWSAATWRTVLAGSAKFAAPLVTMAPGDRPGLQNVLISNPGDGDIRLPSRISLPGCAAGDGVNGYKAVADVPNFDLVRRDDGLLPGKSSRIIGWTNCLSPKATIDAPP